MTLFRFSPVCRLAMTLNREGLHNVRILSCPPGFAIFPKAGERIYGVLSNAVGYLPAPRVLRGDVTLLRASQVAQSFRQTTMKSVILSNSLPKTRYRHAGSSNAIDTWYRDQHENNEPHYWHIQRPPCPLVKRHLPLSFGSTPRSTSHGWDQNAAGLFRHPNFLANSAGVNVWRPEDVRAT